MEKLIELLKERKINNLNIFSVDPRSAKNSSRSFYVVSFSVGGNGMENYKAACATLEEAVSEAYEAYIVGHKQPSLSTSHVELNALLQMTCNHDQAMEFFRNGGEFDSEEYLVRAIRNYLMTDEIRKTLYEKDISLEDLLNGRVPKVHNSMVKNIFDEWNKKIGMEYFFSY